MKGAVVILLVDNYDSFTYNLAHLFQELGAEVIVLRNDAVDADEAERMTPSHLVISPAPAGPEEAGASVEIVRRLGPRVPTLGVCLGHQVIVQAFGGEIGQAHRLLHGKASAVTHDRRGIFDGLLDPLEGGRYHSLAATRGPGRVGGLRDRRGRRGHGRAHRDYPSSASSSTRSRC